MNGEKSKCLKKIKVLPQSIQIEIPSAAWHQPKSTSEVEILANQTNNNDKKNLCSTNKSQIIRNKNVSAETKHFLAQHQCSKQQNDTHHWWQKICFEISCFTSCKSIRVHAKKIKQGFPASSLVPWVLVTNSLIQVSYCLCDKILIGHYLVVLFLYHR